MKKKAPDWTLLCRAHRVWIEDDATTNQIDHESVGEAVKRILKLESLVPLETWDGGESLYKRLNNGYVICETYPGSSGIYQWPLPISGMSITVALKGGSTLRTYISNVWPDGSFSANHDDRPKHLVTDHTITWLLGHWDPSQSKAIALSKFAIREGRVFV